MNDSFGKGFHTLIAYVLNNLMTGRCPRKITTVTAEVPLTLIASVFKNVLLLRDLNRHLDCTNVSFNPENGVFSKIKND